MKRPKVVLVTGYPKSFLANRITQKLLDSTDAEVRLLVRARFRDQAERDLAKLGIRARQRVHIFEGDVASMDMGLSGAEFRELAAEVDVIHHCAAITYLGAPDEQASTVNIDGTREVLELAGEAEHLERLVHWSTAMVSGKRRGYVLEDELQSAVGFRNVIEETRFSAETLVQAASDRIPTTILRPSIIVGDSVTGEIDRLEGPYLLVLLMLNAPADLRIPLPGRGDIPLNLVPIDYVVEAGCFIAEQRQALGKSFHIVDPCPVTARRVFELIAQAAGRPLPRGSLPTTLAAAVLRAPGLERLAHVPRAFLEQLATEVVYDDRNARQLLEEEDLHCPCFEDYVETMVKFVREQHREPRTKHEIVFEEDDVLDG